MDDPVDKPERRSGLPVLITPERSGTSQFMSTPLGVGQGCPNTRHENIMALDRAETAEGGSRAKCHKKPIPGCSHRESSALSDRGSQVRDKALGLQGRAESLRPWDYG